MVYPIGTKNYSKHIKSTGHYFMLTNSSWHTLLLENPWRLQHLYLLICFTLPASCIRKVKRSAPTSLWSSSNHSECLLYADAFIHFAFSPWTRTTWECLFSGRIE